MKYIIILVFLFISLRCVATSCVSSEMNVISFSNLYKSKFTFDIKQKASGNVIFNVQLPLVIDGHKFKSLYLAGMSGKTKDPVWGLPVAAEGSPQISQAYHNLIFLTFFQSQYAAHAKICLIAAWISSAVIFTLASLHNRLPR